MLHRNISSGSSSRPEHHLPSHISDILEQSAPPPFISHSFIHLRTAPFRKETERKKAGFQIKHRRCSIEKREKRKEKRKRRKKKEKRDSSDPHNCRGR
jgi:hypothetical protein